MAEAKKKKGFKLPHILFLMLGIVIFMSLMTYVIPAGEFAKDKETGRLIGDQFKFIGKQSPISPIKAFLLILQGMQNSAMVMALVLVGGGTIGIILDTGAFDELVNFSVYKLKDQGVNIMVPAMFVIMGLLGAFGGSDAMVAIVPLGIMFARKLKLDPIVAAAVTFMATMVGFATGPTKLMIPQTMLGIPVYSGFGPRFVIMWIAIIIGAIYTLWYAKRIQKDPNKSFMGNTDWLNDYQAVDELKEVKLNTRALGVTVVFFLQYVPIIYLMTVGVGGKRMGNETMVAITIVVSIICGLIYKMNFDQIGKSFAKGVCTMGFVVVVIGLAGTMNLIMNQGKILHTIVYTATLPLFGLHKGLVAIGISLVIMVVNVFIPSASSKAAILIPIVQPMAETLGIPMQVAAQAFQVGDGFTNSITPALGWTAGSLETAKVSFNQWWKFAIPLVIILMIIAWIELFFLSAAGWTGI